MIATPLSTVSRGTNLLACTAKESRSIPFMDPSARMPLTDGIQNPTSTLKCGLECMPCWSCMGNDHGRPLCHGFSCYLRTLLEQHHIKLKDRASRWHIPCDIQNSMRVYSNDFDQKSYFPTWLPGLPCDTKLGARPYHAILQDLARP